MPPSGIFGRALALYSAHRIPDALALLEQVHDEPADAAFLRGLLEAESGDPRRGSARARLALAHYPAPAFLCRRLGELLQAAGDAREAARWIREAAAREPGHASDHFRLGNALRAAGDLRAAERRYRDCIALAPSGRDGYLGLAFLLQAEDRLDEAAATVMDLAHRVADDAGELEKCMSFLEDLHRPDLAGAVAAGVTGPGRADSRFLCRLGRLQQKLGQFGDAERSFGEALELDPRSGLACLGLATGRRFTQPDDAVAGRVRSVLERSDLTDIDESCARFALGKILDDCGQWDAAYAQIARANAIRLRGVRFDPVHERAHSARVIEATVQGRRQAPAQDATDLPHPVFIVGMPRSGTTLVERILSAHPEVHAAGELDRIELIAARLGVLDDPRRLMRVPPAELQAAAAMHRRFLRALGPGARWVTDKNPSNHRHLALIARLFPDARIIHCRRDPMDTCLSIFFNTFAHEGLDWSYSLETIGDAFAGYRRIMDAWHTEPSLPTCEIRYESLVADPAAGARTLVTSLDLEFEPALLGAGHQRAIGTASLWQARQPIHDASVGRWRHYAAALEPLRVRLEDT